MGVGCGDSEGCDCGGWEGWDWEAGVSAAWGGAVEGSGRSSGFSFCSIRCCNAATYWSSSIFR